MGMMGSCDTGTVTWYSLGVSGYGTLMMVELIKFTSLAFLRLCWRYSQPSVASMLLTLDVLQHLCSIHHAAFRSADSRQLISLMLFGSQTELAYSRTGVTTAFY